MNTSGATTRALMRAAPSLSGADIVAMMRQHHKTIAGLAASMNIPQNRVRLARANGVCGQCYVMDWLEAITGSTGQTISAF